MSQDTNDVGTASSQPNAKDAIFFYTILTSMKNKPQVSSTNFLTIHLQPCHPLTRLTAKLAALQTPAHTKSACVSWVFNHNILSRLYFLWSTLLIFWNRSTGISSPERQGTTMATRQGLDIGRSQGKLVAAHLLSRLLILFLPLLLLKHHRQGSLVLERRRPREVWVVERTCPLPRYPSRRRCSPRERVPTGLSLNALIPLRMRMKSGFMTFEFFVLANSDPFIECCGFSFLRLRCYVRMDRDQVSSCSQLFYRNPVVSVLDLNAVHCNSLINSFCCLATGPLLKKACPPGWSRWSYRGLLAYSRISSLKVVASIVKHKPSACSGIRRHSMPALEIDIYHKTTMNCRKAKVPENCVVSNFQCL